MAQPQPLTHPYLQVSVWNPNPNPTPTCKVSVFNSTTITYTAEICVEIAPDAGGGTPRVRFVRMEHMCR